MVPMLSERFGNPSGAHRVADDARRALDDARDAVAAALGCLPGEVVFTSGGTEAANLAILGASRTGRSGAVVCSAVEHPAVLEPARSSGATSVPVDRFGRVDLDALAAALHPAVAVVSVMLANNEVGTLQPVPEVAELVRERAPGAVLHTDAVQGVGWLDVASATAGAALVSVSAHKFGGPQGAGALVVRHGTSLVPVLRGGPQERGRRPGTPNTPGAVGMAAALASTVAEAGEAAARVRALRDRLADGLLDAVSGLVETVGDRSLTLPNIWHVCVEGVEREELVALLDEAGICVSAGSSCASGALEPSHVLLAMGIAPELARGALRFSLGASTTEDEVDAALEIVPKVIEQLRR